MPSTKVVVNLEGASYDVRIGEGLLAGLGQRVRATLPDATAAVLVSDTNVAPLYGAAVHASLKEAGLRVVDITIPAGVQSKSVALVSEIWSAMARQNIDRDSVVVALGGGVVCDVAGFVAATYMRGIQMVHAPTSLFAMVDASVGGKCAIDLPEGKNLVGAFLQPAYVCASLDVLATLPEAAWQSGCAVIAKAAAVSSDEFFFWLADHAAQLANRDPDVVVEAVARSVVFKADVVAADAEDRSGVRARLSYGHTLGHAVDSLAGPGTYTHGACVAEGMRFAARLGAEVAGTPLDFVHEQDALLDALGLEALPFAAEADSMIAAMRADKKTNQDSIMFVVPTDVGACDLTAVPEDTLRSHLSAWARSKE